MARQKGAKNRPKEVIEAERKAKEARRAAKAAGGASTGGMKSPGPGHNSELTEGERQSRFIIGLAEIERLKADADSAGSKVRNERKRIMAYGFTKEEIDYALYLRKTKPEEAIAAHRRLMQAARFVNHPIGTQPDMFDETSAVDTALKRAQDGGHMAGLEGQPCKPPYDAGSTEGQAWIEYWHIGVAERNNVMNAAVQATEPKPQPSDAAEAFDDAMPDAPTTALEGEGDAGSEGEAGSEPGSAAVTAEDAAAGRQAFREALRDNIKSGDDHNRQTESQIQEERRTEPVGAA